MQVSACTLEHERRRFWAFARRALTGAAKQGPSAPRSTCAVTDPQGSSSAAKHIGRTRNPTRVCLGVTTETSEVGTVWRRLDKIREGSRRVSILDAEKASARGASKRDCPKLATANSFADSPLP
jgi:hypothetical protein